MTKDLVAAIIIDRVISGNSKLAAVRHSSPETVATTSSRFKTLTNLTAEKLLLLLIRCGGRILVRHFTALSSILPGALVQLIIESRILRQVIAP